MLPDPETCRALARAVTEAGKWPWMGGMLAIDDSGHRWRIRRGQPLDHLVADGEPAGWVGGWESTAPILGAVPDFTDPLTAAGALLAAREVWAHPWLGVVHDNYPAGPRWVVLASWPHGRVLADGPTELEALIAAILAAPPRTLGDT